MNAPPWPVNPGVGEMFQNWVWSGSQWIASPTTGMRVLTRIFTTSGSYMPSPGLISLTVECLGGGGGGGSSGPSTNPLWIMAGGGGGSGGYSRKTLPAALVRGGVPVTVGEGGAGGGSTGGVQPIGAAGSPGGATSFGALCLANGGAGGRDNDFANNWGTGGAGGLAGIGDLAMSGASGSSGTAQQLTAALLVFAYEGLGGAIFGGTHGQSVGPGAATGISGSNADANSGAGGSGAVTNQNPTSQVAGGGNGGSGLCIVTEYCWGDVDQPDRRPAFDVNLNLRQPPCPPGPWPGPWPRDGDP